MKSVFYVEPSYTPSRCRALYKSPHWQLYTWNVDSFLHISSAIFFGFLGLSKTQAAWQIQYASFQGPAPSRDILGGTFPNSLSSNGTTGNSTKKKKALPAFALDFGNGA